MKIKKGDNVQVISGNDRGKVGRVIKVYPSRNRLIVEGINIVKKHMRPSQDTPQGGILKKESTIHVSNVMIISNDKPTRVGYKFLDNGKKVRIAKSTGEIID